MIIISIINSYNVNQLIDLYFYFILYKKTVENYEFYT